MIKITLDGIYSEDKERFYAYLNTKMSLKENNLDAVYEYLSNIPEPVQLTIVHAQAIKARLGNYGGTFMKIVQKAEQKNPHLKVKIIYQEVDKKYKQTENVEKSGKQKEKTDRKTGKKTDKKTYNSCKYAGKCGGCSGQRNSYKKETEEKQQWIKNLLGNLTNVDELVTMKQPYHYRHKVHAVFSYDRGGHIKAGVYEENTHKVVDIEHCAIEEEKAGAIIRTVKELMPRLKIKAYDEDNATGILRHVLIRTGYATGEILVVIVTGTPVFPAKKTFVKELTKRHPEITTIVQNINGKNTSMVLGTKEDVWYGRGYIEDRLCGKTFRISPRSFYQVNPEQTEILYRMAIEYAGLTGKETVIDAYCGIGTIGIIAASKAKQVISVELNQDAVKDARVNAKINKTDNIAIYQGDAGRFMVHLAQQGEKADVVFMDPPRSGSSEEFLNSVVKLAPEKVVYISCNPETMRDDLLYLMERQYQIKECRGVDLFPWTRHVETVCLLSNRKPDTKVRIDVDLEDYYRIKDSKKNQN